MKKEFINFLSGVILLIVFFSAPQSGDACSTFQLQHGKQLVVGKNFDFHTDIGMVIINKRNVAKTALLEPPEKPAQWESKYGSITFNQVGREFPFSGINEAGLVVEIMWLDESKYPDPDERPAIGELQWIQYQLDNSRSVDEVIKSDEAIRISQSSPVHFFVGDRRGKAVTIEFIDGKLVFHTSDNLPVKVLTNHTYQKSLQYLKTHKGFGGQEKFSFTRSSLDRFARAAKKIKDYRWQRQPSTPIVEYAFDILSSVSQGVTVWSIVYDVPHSRIYFKTVRKKEIKIIHHREVDFTCGPPVKVLDMNTDLKGNVTEQFVDYTTEMNREMVFSVFNNYKANNFMEYMSDFALEVISRFPETFMCKQKEIGAHISALY
ncbi:linear amide C-N hydrolase [Acidobacteriota bacterium]